MFATLCLLQLGHALAIRSQTELLFVQGIFTNRPLLLSFAATFLFQCATIYVAFLNPVFKTEPLTIKRLVIVLMFSTAIFTAVEIEKHFRSRLNIKKEV